MSPFNNELSMKVLSARVHDLVKATFDAMGHRPGVTVTTGIGHNEIRGQHYAACMIRDDILGLQYETRVDADVLGAVQPAEYAKTLAADALRGYLNQEVNMELGLFVPAANRMVSIRPIRGSYAEAMKVACTIPAMEDRLELMMLPWYGPISPLTDGGSPCYTYSGGVVDERNGWKTYLICRNGMPCAYASGPIGDAE